VSENQLHKKGMIWGILVSITVLSHPVHGSLTITDNENRLMRYTKLIGEEYFTPGDTTATSGRKHNKRGSWIFDRGTANIRPLAYTVVQCGL
jgi:hypothetical protein